MRKNTKILLRWYAGCQKVCINLCAIVGCLVSLVVIALTIQNLIKRGHLNEIEPEEKYVKLDNKFDVFLDSVDSQIIASSILRLMNFSIDPCENFYEYACQGWPKQNAVPSTKSRWDIWDVIKEETMDEVIEILEQPGLSTDTNAFKEAQEIYKLCVKRGQDDREHKEYCLSVVYTLYRISVGHKYVSKKFKSSKAYNHLVNMTKTLFANTKKAFQTLLEESLQKNFDVQFSSQNISNLPICIGYPSWILNRTRVDLAENLMKPVDWRDGKYICDESESLETCKCQWLEIPENTAATFSLTEFQIYIKSHILSWYFERGNVHKALVYGSVGNVFGHEMAHAFSDLGWEKFENDSLTTVSECLVEQYQNFSLHDLQSKFIAQDNVTLEEQRNLPFENISLDGTLTVDENFADNAGLLIAYNAYKQVMTDAIEYDEASKLPGLEEFSDDQLFFLAFAQDFCGSYSVEGLNKAMLMDEHSPHMFRILGALQNSEEFASAWNCSLGSKMNPQKKCLVFPK